MFDSINVQATAPGNVFTPMLPSTGDSLQIRNFDESKYRCYLVGLFHNFNIRGILRIISPRLHDREAGIEVAVPGANARNNITAYQGIMLRLYSGDVLNISCQGSTVGGEIEQTSLLLWYENLDNIPTRYIGIEELKKRFIRLNSKHFITNGGILGGYSGIISFETAIPFLKENTDYAILGATGIGTILTSIKMPETGNMRINFCPSATFLERMFFIELALATKFDCIPIFNSENDANSTIEIIVSQTGGSTRQSFYLAELS